jgi:hypothetical protein
VFLQLIGMRPFRKRSCEPHPRLCQ